MRGNHEKYAISFGTSKNKELNPVYVVKEEYDAKIAVLKVAIKGKASKEDFPDYNIYALKGGNP